MSQFFAYLKVNGLAKAYFLSATDLASQDVGAEKGGVTLTLTMDRSILSGIFGLASMGQIKAINRLRSQFDALDLV